MEAAFPINPVIRSATFNPTAAGIGELKIVFIKRTKSGTKLEAREYGGVPSTVFYPWLYKSTASEVLSYYARHIRKKFTLLNIKPIAL